MKQLMIIPIAQNLTESVCLAKEYHLGFEYNDFFSPKVLDDVMSVQKLVEQYQSCQRYGVPIFCTLHGAFYDVNVVSADEQIQKISALRVEQSLEVARQLNASAVIFHTNYNPFLNMSSYIKKWVDENADYWAGVLEMHKEENIYLENMFDTTPDVLAALSRKLAIYPNYGVCFDYAHAALTKVGLSCWAGELGEYVRHVHVNDNDLISDLHLAVGNGKIAWDGFYQNYEKYMPDATVLVEVNSVEAQRKSLERFVQDGFWKRWE